MEPIRGIKEINDPIYIYKMETMIFHKDKRKTTITNLDRIAHDLKILDPSIIILFLKKRLSIPMITKNNGVIISNDIDTQLIKDALYEFIEYFVFCKKCQLPELIYVMIGAQCCACGTSCSIENNQYTEPVIKAMNPGTK